MKDAASIAAKYRPKVGGYIGEADDHRTDLLAAAIERYAARLVKAERERCVGIVDDCGMIGSDASNSIINAIQAKRPSRKRK